MVGRHLQEVVRETRQLLRQPSAPGLTDAELIQRFVSVRDEAAFELLVWRHAPTVLSVCARVLNDGHEAEEAFQATFLTLARKAGSIGRRQAVASWLYKVAYRIALRARARSARRLFHERAFASAAPAYIYNDLTNQLNWREIRPILDAEVSRLPEKYRAVFILCYLQGKTNEQAAKELGCPKGTVLSRLARGRERLRKRLIGRGVALCAAPLAALLAQNADALAQASPVLVNATVHMSILFAAGKAAAGLISASVQRLAEEAIQDFAWRKLWISAALLTFTILCSSVGFAAYGGFWPASPPPASVGGCHSAQPQPATAPAIVDGAGASSEKSGH